MVVAGITREIEYGVVLAAAAAEGGTRRRRIGWDLRTLDTYIGRVVLRNILLSKYIAAFFV